MGKKILAYSIIAGFISLLIYVLPGPAWLGILFVAILMVVIYILHWAIDQIT